MFNIADKWWTFIAWFGWWAWARAHWFSWTLLGYLCSIRGEIKSDRGSFLVRLWPPRNAGNLNRMGSAFYLLGVNIIRVYNLTCYQKRILGDLSWIWYLLYLSDINSAWRHILTGLVSISWSRSFHAGRFLSGNYFFNGIWRMILCKTVLHGTYHVDGGLGPTWGP